MDDLVKKKPYFTWGCSDDLAFRLKKTLYCSEGEDCYDASSAALTDVAVSMLRESATCSRRKLSHRYASSLTRQLSISPCALMMSILYSERLRQLNPSYLDRMSSSDLYVVSMLVATKFLHDEGEQEEIYNDEWAEAAGLAVSTVNRLEREFLDAMDWNIYVHPQEFLTFCSKIETRIALKYGLQRGWFSYTDLTQCLLALKYQTVFHNIFEKTVKIIGGCVLVYGMSLSLIISSVITYAATTSPVLPNSSNNTSTNTGMNSFNSHHQHQRTSALYSERSFTRERRRRQRLLPTKTTKDTTNNTTQQHDEFRNDVFNTHGDEDFMLQRLENSTQHGSSDDSNELTQDIFKCGTGTCGRSVSSFATPPPPPLHLRFESRFQHQMKQTRLSISLDMKDLRMFNKHDNGNWDKMFHSTGYNEHDGKVLDAGYDSEAFKKEKFHHPVDRNFFKRNPKNSVYNTRVFGMPVI